jgi:menaquinone-dependent protoporphyrinogen oxidase
MNMLIVYATTEGQTRKIAQSMYRTIEDAGHDVSLVDCSGQSQALELRDFDAIILAASVHNRRYQASFYEFITKHLDTLRAKPLAFVSVSLAVTLASGEAEAREYVDAFIAETGLQPHAVHLAEGAIRYFQYSASDAATIDLIVFKGQQKMPDRDGNPEYTNWQALEEFTKAFIAQADNTETH